MGRRPSVLVVTTSYPSPADPVAGVFVRELARATMPHADVRILHLDRGARPWLRAVPAVGEELPVWRVGFPASTPAWAPGALAAIAVGLHAAGADGWRPRLLHAHFFLAGFPAVLAGRLRRLPVVVTEHWTVFTPEDPATLPRLLAAVARFTFRHAAAVLPVSAELKVALQEFGVRRPMEVVPNTVDVETFRPPETVAPPSRPALLLCVGLLTRQKGLDILLRAVALVTADVRLDVVGDGALRSELELLAAEIGIAERVTFHGVLTKAAIADLMRTADLYVSASRYENNPVAVIEAQASGLPVVGTAVGAVAEMVGADGIVVPPGDAHALAHAIDDALARDYDAKAIAARAAGRYGAAAVGAAVARIYADVLPAPS